MLAMAAVAFNAGAGGANPPGNDACGAGTALYAIPGSGGAVSGSLVDASRDAGRIPCVWASDDSGVDVYHYIVPAVSGVWFFDTCSTGSFLDTVVSVHSLNCPASNGNMISGACNDDSCGPTSPTVSETLSHTSAALAAGVPYIVRVGVYSAQLPGGPYILTATAPGGPPNDECGAANPALIVGVPQIGTTVSATTSFAVDPASLCGSYSGSGGAKDVFFRFTPASTGAFNFSLCGSLFDTVLSVHSDCPASGVNVVGCNDDSNSTVQCAGTWSLQSYLPNVVLAGGNVYYVRVAGFNANPPSVGPFTLQVTASAVQTGACCLTDGQCLMVSSAECTGTHKGPGTICESAFCPQPGACCRIETGECSLSDSSACSGIGMWFIGTGSSCPNPACLPPLGICCRGTTCAQSIQGDCTGANTLWSPVQTPCDPSSTVTPCCRADFNKAGGISVQDIFDFLAAWFAGSPDANITANGAGSPTAQSIFDFLAAWFRGGC